MLNLPRVLLMILVGLLLPIEYVEVFAAGAIPVGPTKLVALLFMLVVLLQWATGHASLPRSPKHLFVVLFALSLGVSTGVSVYHGIPLAILAPFVSTAFLLVGFYFVVVVGVRSETELDLLLGALVLGGVVVSGTALAGIGFTTWSEEGERLGGLGGNVNELGFNLALVVPTACGFIATARTGFRRLAAFIALLISLVAVAHTLSRTTFVSMIVMSVYGLVYFKRLGAIKYAIPVVLAGLLGLALVPSVRERLDTMTSATAFRRDASAQERMQLNALGLRAFTENPLVGVGVERFGIWSRKYTWQFGAEKQIHNAYLKVAAEQGLVGLVPFVAILILTWRELSQAISLMARREGAGDRQARSLRIRGMYLQIALVGMIVGHLAQTSRDYKATWLVPALGTVTLACARQRAGREVPTTEAAQPFYPDAVTPVSG
jgi:O-antigen ligase